MKKFISFTCLLCFVGYLSSVYMTAQCNSQLPPLTFINPSFEGTPQAHVTPAPWNTCGLTPDTQPGSWGVNLPPSHGSSYLGLVNSAGWVEGASQQMSGVLLAGVTYTFTVDLAVAANPTVGSGIVAGPSRLVIYGANNICTMTELLWTSPNVNNTNWVTYTVTFTPSQNYSHIYFRVDNTTHNGSYILVDNITPIVPRLPTIDITSHVNGNNTACAFTLSGTLSLPLADSILVTGPFNGSPLHASINGTNWSANLQFNTPGTYTVYARVFYYDATTNSHACSYDSVIVNVSAPTAAFTAQNHCLNSAMAITNTSVGFGTTQLTGWAWNFGDGFTSNAQNPSHTYSAPGTYTVTLTVTDQFGCTSTTTRNVTVYPLPTASFTFANACQNDNLTFTSTSAPGAGTIAQTLWDVDNNGTTDYTTSPGGHRFTNAGTHPVTLIVVTNNGCRDTVTQNVTVYSLPVASFTATPACQNQAVGFQSTSTVVNSTISQTFWDVNNDGVNDYTTSPASHVYTQAGNHTIRLIVQSAQGCRDTISQTVTVYPLPVASFTAVNACQNDAVSLTSTSTVSSGSITNHFWDVNNDNTTDYTTTTVNHPYAQNGNHLVTLIVESNQGCRDTISQSITVYPLPVASFISQNACNQDAVSFSSTSTVSSGTIVQYSWDVESDGVLDYSNASGSHIYPQDGTYAITLIVESNEGCRDTVRQNITVYPLPIAAFSVGNACLNEAVNFQSNATVSSGNIVSTLWDIDNNNTIDYNGTTGTHTYPTIGNYTIQLIVVTDNGCSDSITQNVIVHPLPQANFVVANVCDQSPVSFFSNSSVVSGSINTTTWDMESDGSVDYTTPNGTHVYPNAGTYSITLIVITDMGCADTAYQNVTIYPLPVANFGVDKDVLTLDDAVVRLNNQSSGETNWEWNLLGNYFFNEPNVFYEFLDTGEFCFDLRVISDRGCEDQTTRCVTVKPGYNFYIPNTFTPNEDKNNPVFIPKGLGFQTFSMEIFTRWGEKIFESNSIQNGWSGIDNDGKNYPQGVYVYKIQVIDYKNNVYDYVGNVNLIR